MPFQLIRNHEMEFEGLIKNVTIFHPGRLYWIILLQSNLKFITQSVQISSPPNNTLSSDGIASILDARPELLEYRVPPVGNSQTCIEKIGHRQYLKDFYCYNSVPSSSHQIVIFYDGYLHRPTDVSKSIFCCLPLITCMVSCFRCSG